MENQIQTPSNDRKRNLEPDRSTPLIGGLLGSLSGYFKRARRSYAGDEDPPLPPTPLPPMPKPLEPPNGAADDTDTFADSWGASSRKSNGVSGAGPSSVQFGTSSTFEKEAGTASSNPTTAASLGTKSGFRIGSNNFGSSGTVSFGPSSRFSNHRKRNGAAPQPDTIATRRTQISTGMNGGVSFSRAALSRRGTPHHKRTNGTAAVSNAASRKGTPYAKQPGGNRRSSFPAASPAPSSRSNAPAFSQTPRSSARRRRSNVGNDPSSLDRRRINFESAKMRAVSPGTRQRIVSSMRNDDLFGPPPSSGRKKMTMGSRMLLGSNQTGGSRLLVPNDIRSLDGERKASVVRGRREQAKTGAFVDRVGGGGGNSADYWNRDDMNDCGDDGREGGCSTVATMRRNGDGPEAKRGRIMLKDQQQQHNDTIDSTPASPSPPSPSETLITIEEIRKLCPNTMELGNEIDYARLCSGANYTVEDFTPCNPPPKSYVESLNRCKPKFAPIKVPTLSSSSNGQNQKIKDKPPFKTEQPNTSSSKLSASAVPFSFMPNPPPTKKATTTAGPSFSFPAVKKLPLPSKPQATPKPPPAGSGWGNMFAMKSGEWKCDVCLVTNPPGTIMCTSCETKKPEDTPVAASSSSSSSLPKATHAAAGGFFAPPVTKEGNGSVKDKPFGTVGDGGSKPKTTFTFGTTPTPTPPTPSTSMGAVKNAKITFGAPPVTAPPSSSGTKFTFGASAAAPDTGLVGENNGRSKRTRKEDSDTGGKKQAPAFQFGVAASSAPLSTKVELPSTTSTSTAATTNKPSLGLTFGLATNTQDQTSKKKRKDDGGFSFGTTTKSPAVAPVVPKTTITNVVASNATSTTSSTAPSFAFGGLASSTAKNGDNGTIGGIGKDIGSSDSRPALSFGTSTNNENNGGNSSSDKTSGFSFGMSKQDNSSSNSLSAPTNNVSTAPKPSFSFGATTSTNTATTNTPGLGQPSTSTFSFGAANNTTATTKAAPSFTGTLDTFAPSSSKITAPPASSVQPPAPASTANFMFGSTQPPSTATSTIAPMTTPSSTFSFGTTPAPSLPVPTSTAAAPIPSFGAGANNKPFASVTTSNPQPASNGSFTFGAAAPTPAAPSAIGGMGGGAPAPSFSFGASNPTTNTATAPSVTNTNSSTFSFGAAAPAQTSAAPNPFGSVPSQPPQQMQPPQQQVNTGYAFGAAAAAAPPPQPVPAAQFGGFGGGNLAAPKFHLGTGGEQKKKGRRIIRAKRPPGAKR